MESKTTLRLPVIDFAKQEQEWELVKDQVKLALEEYGAFEAVFDKAPDYLELRKALLQGFEGIFDLPLETKQQISHKNLKPFGYTGNPHYEGISVDQANDIEKVELGFTRILWPEGNPQLSKTIQSFSEHLAKFDVTVRRMVLESFGLEKYMDEHLASTTYTLRASKYTNAKNPESKTFLRSHLDKNTLTILCQINHVDGLEVQTKDGEWINAKLSSPDSFIVVIGESLQGWLNGRVPAPYHRVMLKGDKERFSIGLFSAGKDGYIIKTPEQMVNEENPLRYTPFEYVKYLEYLYHNTTAKFQPTLKTYCGV